MILRHSIGGTFQERAVMRLFVILLLIMGLATCASVIPQSEVITPASPALSGLQRYQLIAPEQALQGEPPFRQRYAELAIELQRGLAEQGYQQDTRHPQLRVYYWLAVQDQPLEFRVDNPGLLGPYQSIHRLRDSTGTLRVRLTDLQDQTLWEGKVSTGLSPERDSAELLQQALGALLRQIPQTTRSTMN